MMKRSEPPRLLPHVLQAISELRESGGCSTRHIVDCIRANISSSQRPRNLTLQVRKAIRHGVEHGVIKHRQGRYYTKVVDPLKNAMTSRRRRRRRSSRRGRHRRHHHRNDEEEVSGGATSVESGSATNSEWDRSRSRSRSREPADGHRRRRKGGRRRRRRGRKHSSLTTTGGEEPGKGDVSPQSPKRYNPDKKGYPENYGQMNDAERRAECTNPDCLCNLKSDKMKPEPMDGPARKSRDDFRNDYIN